MIDTDKLIRSLVGLQNYYVDTFNNQRGNSLTRGLDYAYLHGRISALQDVVTVVKELEREANETK